MKKKKKKFRYFEIYSLLYFLKHPPGYPEIMYKCLLNYGISIKENLKYSLVYIITGMGKRE